MTTAANDLMLKLLEDKLYLIQWERHTASEDYYEKGTWRGDMHRKELADQMRLIRNAMRGLRTTPLVLPRNECE